MIGQEPAWREEKRLIEEALAILLPTLTHPHLSVPLGLRLAQLTGLPEARCRKILLWLAQEGHPHATHDGGTIQSYGRYVTRWRWHSCPVRHKPAVGLEARLNAAGVVDTSEW